MNTADGVPFELGMTVYQVKGDYESCDVYVRALDTAAKSHDKYKLAIKGNDVCKVPLKGRWIQWFEITRVYADRKNAIREKIHWMQDHADEILEEIERIEKEELNECS